MNNQNNKKEIEINKAFSFSIGYIRGFYDSYEKTEEIGFIKGETAGKIIEKRNIFQNLIEKNFTDEEIIDILNISPRQLKTMQKKHYALTR